jgi:hypothetical protein
MLYFSRALVSQVAAPSLHDQILLPSHINIEAATASV